MNTTELKILLSDLATFSNPDPALEQYPTPPQIAADMVNRLTMDCDGTDIIDLGTGTGLLAIGAAVQGYHVTGYDIDSDAISIARQNKKQVEPDHGELDLSFLEKDITAIETQADAVIMNPPFGIQERDSNTVFLETAFASSPLVYALLHKSSSSTEETRKFIKEYALQHQFEARIVTEYELNLPRSMSFHKEQSHTIRADLYRFTG